MLLGAVRSKIKSQKAKKTIKVAKITMAEGPSMIVDRLKKRKFNSLEQMAKACKPLIPTDGGYNKIFFTVIFSDGYDYSGRLDLTKSNYSENMFKNHINRFINNVIKQPAGSFYDSMKKEAKNFKRKYQL